MFGHSLENWKKNTGSVVYPPRNYPPPYPTNLIPRWLKNYDKYNYRIYNWSFPGNKNSLFENGGKSKNYLVYEFYLHENRNVYILILIFSHSTSL